MAPEVLNQEKYDGKVDIWSLGITLLELAQGKNPWEELSPFKAMFKIREEQILDLQNPSDYSPEFNLFLKSTLQYDASHRKTAKELLASEFLLNTQPHLEHLKKQMWQIRKKSIEIFRKSILLNSRNDSNILNDTKDQFFSNNTNDIR